MTRFAIACLCIALCSGATNACGFDCETADPDNKVRFDGGSQLSGGTVYQTSGWDGPYLHFPPGRRFVLMHRLGKIPTTIKTYVAFSEKGVGAGDGGQNIAESAGNQVVIESATADEVMLRNDTCADFYLRVVITAESPAADAGTTTDAAPDAPVDAGGG